MIDGDTRLVLLMLLASGVLYDGAVNFTQRQLPSEHGVTSFLVVGGVLWTLFGLLLIEGVRVFRIALLCFAWRAEHRWSLAAWCATSERGRTREHKKPRC